MLYLATALKSTAITHAITIPHLTSSADVSQSVPSLVVAKGNTLEVWDAEVDGLKKVAETEVWGMIVGLEWVGGGNDGEHDRPHIVVLTDHPLSRLLLYTYVSNTTTHSSLPGTLTLTSYHTLTRLSARPAEYLTGLVADRTAGIVVASLYTGVLVVAEVASGKEDKAKGKRKGGMEEEMEVDEQGDAGGGKEEEEAVFSDVYEINVREHNLLSLSFLRPRTASRRLSTSATSTTPMTLSSTRRKHRDPTLIFLYYTPQFALHLLPRRLSRSKRTFEDLVPPIDVMGSPKFFVPAAKRLLSVEGGVVVLGDEWTAEYEMGFVARRASEVGRRESVGAAGGSGGLSRSPEMERVKMSPELNKRRKGSVGGSFVASGSGSAAGGTAGQAEGAIVGSTFIVKEGWRVRQGFGEVTACTPIASEGTTQAVVLGDEYGRLSMISYDSSTGSSGTPKKSAVVTFLGVTPAPTAICHLDGPYIFLGSQVGDSQLLAIRGSAADSKGKGKADDMQVDGDEVERGPRLFDVMDSWANIGPVQDFGVVEDEGGGGSQIVTASGMSSTGTLRTIRSGLGTNDVAIIEGIDDVTALYSVVSSSLNVTMLLASSINSTRAFRLDASSAQDLTLQEVPAGDSFPLAFAQPTLAASTMKDNFLLQVTPRGVISVDLRTGTTVFEWSDLAADQQVVCAAIGVDYVVLCGRRGMVCTLRIGQDGNLLQSRSTPPDCFINEEISCIDVDVVDVSGSSREVAALGWWGSNTIGLYALPDFSLLGELKLEASHPSSIRIRPGWQVLVGLGSGLLVAYDITFDSAGCLGLANRKQLSLGVEPILLSTSMSDLLLDGDKQMAALGDRVSVIYRERGRVLASSMTGKGVTAVTTMNLPSTGSCIVYADATGLAIKQVSSLKQLQMRKIDLGFDSPHGIAHHRALHAYGVALNRTVLEQEFGNEEKASYFRLYEDNSFRAVAEFALPPREEVVSLNLVTLSGRPLFSLGTVVPPIPTDVNSVKRGYIRLLEGVNDETYGYKVTLVAELDLGGTVFDSKAIWDQLVVGVDNRVELFSFSPDAPSATSALSLTSSWGNAFFASCLTVQRIRQPDGSLKERLHVGDGMRSVFSLERNGKGELQDVARDLKPHWVLTMEELETEGGAVIFSDTNYNLLTMRHKDNQLENAAEIALHEVAARFRRGALAPAFVNKEAVKPEVLFTTTSGALYVVADLGDNEAKILSDLQRNMDEVIPGPGISWKAYREIHTEGSGKPRQTVGFIDGDFVKRFLDQTKVNVRRIMDGTNAFERVGLGLGKAGQGVEVSEVIRVLEAVGSLH